MTLSAAGIGEWIDSAIINEEVVSFWYERLPQSGDVMLRTLSPYECSEDGETVLGYDHAREGLRRFELSKIATPERPGDEEYVKPVTEEDK